MTPDFQTNLKRLLVKHEGKRNHAYMDTLGNLTIGIGYNLTARGLPDEWINEQYEQDVAYFYSCLSRDFPWFSELSEPRQAVLVDMAFMGYQKLKGFKQLFAALQRQDYNFAGSAIMDSKWATQVHGRASELADIMVRGKY